MKLRYIHFLLTASLAVIPVPGMAAIQDPGVSHQIRVIGNATEETQFQSTVQDWRLVGTENFANSTLEMATGAKLNVSILSPGASVLHFPGGTNTTAGITFQVNTLGGSPATPNPGDSLYANRSGAVEGGLIRVGPDATNHSLDLFIDPPDFRGEVRAVRFIPFREGGGDAEIRVYSNSNVLLATQTVSGLSLDGSKRIAIIAPPGETIFRINYWVPNGYGDVSRIEVYAETDGPLIPPKLAAPPSLHPGTGHVSLSYIGTSGHSYRLEVSENLTTWAFLAELTADPDGKIVYEDTEASGSARRFYRLIAL